MGQYIDKLKNEDSGKKKTKQDIIDDVEEAKIIIEDILRGRNKIYNLIREFSAKKIPVYFISVEPNQFGIFSADERGDFFACVEDNAKVAWAIKEGFSQKEIDSKIKTSKYFARIEDFINCICKPQIKISSQ